MRLAVIWIDWYAYHVARFRALAEHPLFRDRCLGIELVGAAGVHQGMVFRHSKRDGLNIQTLLPEASWSNTSRLRISRLLWDQLNAFDADAVLVPGYYTGPGIAAALWAKTQRRRSILMTESTREDHRRSTWKEAVKRQLVTGLFDSAMVGGVRHQSYLQELGIPSTRIGSRYDVVDNDFYRTSCERERECSSAAAHRLPEKYFLYVGRLAPEKNLELLLRSFALYRSRGGSWDLVIAGAGPSMYELRQQAQSTQAALNIHFAGLKSTDELIPYYAFAGAFVLPSTREPWGLVVNEAMAAGLPVIVSQACGCADDLVEHGRNGLVIDPTDQTSLVEALQRISSQDLQKHKDMSMRALERIAQYSPAKWAEEVASVCSAKSLSIGRAA